MLAIDTEVPGLDLYHSCKPYLVTTCTDKEVQRFWEWDVDPYTRQPVIPPGDVEEIREWVVENLPGGVVFHNTKFDVKALDTIGVWEGFDLDRLWAAVDDTLLAGHLLASNQPHNLTDMTSHYLGVNIGVFEEVVRDCVQECRRLVRSKAFKEELGGWKLAKKDLETDPSITDKAWPADMWLPRAVARQQGYKEPAGWCSHTWLPNRLCKRCKGHRYWLALQEYANADSSVTVKLWERLRSEVKGRGLWKIYQHRRQLLPVAYAMEQRGITVNSEALYRLEEEYREEADKCDRLCKAIANTYDYDLTLPRGGNNKSLVEFCFGRVDKEKEEEAPTRPRQRTPYLDLPVLERTETGAPSLNKNVIEQYLVTLEPNSKQHVFVTSLSRKRKRDTSLSYMAAYKRFWLPLNGEGGNWYVLHPNLNITGTSTTRWSCERPNEQNISKKGIEARCPKCRGTGCTYCGDVGWVSYNLRYAFGPAPGREWWSCDAKNIELRIPAYESGEQELIGLFERPDEPPYFGSTHLLNFHTVYPDIWEGELGTICNSKTCCKGQVVDLTRIGPHCKKKFADTWYQYCKNGGFACVPMSTEALTREGWKRYEEITTNDQVLAYQNGKLVWTPVLRKVKLRKAKLMKLYNNHFKAVITPEHRWLGERRHKTNQGSVYTERFFDSDKVLHDDTIYLSAPTVNTKAVNITDYEAALLGFVYGDGCLWKSEKGPGPSRGASGTKVGFSVKIYQKKEPGVVYLDNLLKEGNIPHKKYYLKNRDAYSWSIEPNYARELWKRAGMWEVYKRSEVDFEEFVKKLDHEGRLGFLEGVFQAEGCLDKNGIRLYSQNDGKFADGIKLAVFMTGNFPLQLVKKPYKHYKSVGTEIRAGKPYVTGQRLSKEYLPGTHDVWCLTTKHGTWVMRQGGQIMLTGNCQYGAVEREDREGTADRAFHRRGSHARLKARFSRLEAHNQRCIRQAEKHGYVETIPSKGIDPDRGYPLLCTRTENGRILPTVPLNYRTQGTACVWMAQAMIRCYDKLNNWNRSGFDGYIIAQVHDELLFDLPKHGDPRKDFDKEKVGKPYFRTSNLWRMRELQRLMEKGGEEINIPTPTSCEYHETSWAEGVTMC